MSVYPKPKKHNGSINDTFNIMDYKISTNKVTGLSIADGDARYLQNSGEIVSSANTSFNNAVTVSGLLKVDDLAEMNNLSVQNLFKAKKSSDSLTAANFTSNQEYDLNNGMVYSITSDSTTVDNVTFINVPDDANQSYIFTFIFKTSQVDTPYYIKTANISVNDVSISLHGLQNIELPINYTYLVQQITIIYGESDLFALTSVAAY
jgi:hypothetical protein